MTSGTPADPSLLAPDRVLALVSAPWAGPSRPAPTVLRELSRRWRDHRQVILLEHPDDEILTEWGITVLPTWVLFERRPAEAEAPSTLPHGVVRLAGTSPVGDPCRLDGLWHEVRRLTGAQPKHVIATEFGPDA